MEKSDDHPAVVPRHAWSRPEFDDFPHASATSECEERMGYPENTTMRERFLRKSLRLILSHTLLDE